jgi:hypothetical protein
MNPMVIILISGVLFPYPEKPLMKIMHAQSILRLLLRGIRVAGAAWMLSEKTPATAKTMAPRNAQSIEFFHPRPNKAMRKPNIGIGMIYVMSAVTEKRISGGVPVVYWLSRVSASNRMP